MGRHERRSDLARYRRETSGSLLTYLVDVDQPLDGLLQRAAYHWLDALSVRCRHCIICSSWLVDRQDVGALLMSTADTARPTSVGSAAICKACWNADLGTDALERACTAVLVRVVPGGRFAPLGTRQ